MKVCGVNKRTDVSKEDNGWWNFEVRKVVSEKKRAWLDLLSTKRLRPPIPNKTRGDRSDNAGPEPFMTDAVGAGVHSPRRGRRLRKLAPAIILVIS
ncbi:hypothetical protein EVAR_19394_1 [Eumeta japonica]|uniref:Uncharacterized protein n=1 Tax=Eumeta variegata TaxID=151549 RepID=A0A4C1TRK4_EUMVA|nr:hypothetical protein EVAR_19394_1 [Eumeta japonica]